MKYLKSYFIFENNNFSLPYEFKQSELLDISNLDISDIIDHIEISGYHPKNIIKNISLVNDKNVAIYVDGQLDKDAFLKHQLFFNIDNNDDIFNTSIENLNSLLDKVNNTNNEINNILVRYEKLNNVSIECKVKNLFRYELVIIEKESCKNSINKIYTDILGTGLYKGLANAISKLTNMYKLRDIPNPPITVNEFEINDSIDKVSIGFLTEGEIVVIGRYSKSTNKLTIDQEEFEKSIYIYFEEIDNENENI